MAKTPTMGRHSIFRGKANGVRVQGIITKTGGERFEEARHELRALYHTARGEYPAVVSDADVIEYLARGATNTGRYLKGKTK